MALRSLSRHPYTSAPVRGSERIIKILPRVEEDCIGCVIYDVTMYFGDGLYLRILVLLAYCLTLFDLVCSKQFGGFGADLRGNPPIGWYFGFVSQFRVNHKFTIL